MAANRLNTTYGRLLWLTRLILAAVFVSAALPKIYSPEDFARAIIHYRVTGLIFSAWIALFLPWFELVAGFGLLLLPLKRASGFALAALLLLFIMMHTQAWIRGLEIACGCFGEYPTESPSATNYVWLITRNGLLLVGCCAILLQDLRNQSKIPIA